MSMDVTSAEGGNDTCWLIARTVHGGAEGTRLLPDAQMRLAGEGVWEALGDHACFGLDLAGPLAAGWYELDGYVEGLESTVMMPCLYPRYAAVEPSKVQIELPDPDASGRVQALVLLASDVDAMDFSPGIGPLRFRLRDFTFRRISRPRALMRMLEAASAPGAAAWPRLHRGLSFAIEAVTRGTSMATGNLFSEYRLRFRPDGVTDYDLWTRRFDTIGGSALAALQESCPTGASPLVSILLPVYQTPEVWLRRCIDSVLGQVWSNWELCIADDASPDERVTAILQEYAQRDARIRVVRREVNGHISAASNTALEMARGDYVALLDHDDELRPHALLEMVTALREHPGIQLAYSDEDKLDAEGRRFDPNFKPDWNPDLLRSQNYLCHFTMIRTSLVREVGGFRTGFEGSQDHDLFLRCTERLQPAQIHHVPKILYHWRAIEGSTALTRESKDYASSAGARAVGEHLQRIGSGASVEELSHGHFRVHWPVPDPAPKVSLIIPTRDRFELLHTCVESILASTDYANFELVVVDNQSRQPEALAYLDELGSRDRVKVLRYDAPFNYSVINNWAARQCDGELIGLVNNDIEVISPGWLREMAAQALRADVGAVGAMLYYPDDTIQHAGVVLGVHGVAAHIYAGMPRGYHGHGARAWVAQNLSAVTGACLLVRRSVFEEAGGLDERLQVAFNDIDFCLRVAERGYLNVWTPFAELYHHESASRGSEDTDEKKARFAGEVQFMKDRWSEVLCNDPAYNPNLSLRSLNFDLAFPPRA